MVHILLGGMDDRKPKARLKLITNIQTGKRAPLVVAPTNNTMNKRKRVLQKIRIPPSAIRILKIVSFKNPKPAYFCRLAFRINS